MEGDAQSFSDDPRLTIFCLRIYILIYRDIIRMLESEIYYVVLHAYIERERERELTGILQVFGKKQKF